MRLKLLALLAFAAAPAGAAQYGGFSRYADEASLKPFTRDLGGVLGSATFHSGRSLGLSGWDVGLRGGAQAYPSKGNNILRNHGVRTFGIPWVQAEVGMPFKLDGFIRGISWEGITVAGGGLRYGLLKVSDKPWSPQLLACVAAHAVVHQDFSAHHLGGNLVASMGIPVFTPYIGAGIDRTRLTVRNSLLDPALNGRAVTTAESRFTAGAKFRPWTFFYIHAAYVMAHGQSGGEAGLGLRF